MLHEVEFGDVVVSTGGSTPCFVNTRYMNSCGQTSVLDVHPDILFPPARVAKRNAHPPGKTDGCAPSL